MPLLDNGAPGYAGHELAASAPVHSVHPLWDVALPLVIAIALPFVLKYALESETVARFFRLSPTKFRSDTTVSTEDIDFDSD